MGNGVIEHAESKFDVKNMLYTINKHDLFIAYEMFLFYCFVPFSTVLRGYFRTNMQRYLLYLCASGALEECLTCPEGSAPPLCQSVLPSAAAGGSTMGREPAVARQKAFDTTFSQRYKTHII